MKSHNFVKYLIFFFSFVTSFESNEIKVAVEIFKRLEIRHCVLVIKPRHSVSVNNQIFSYNLFIAQVERKNLQDCLDYMQMYHLKIGIALKGNIVNHLRDLFEKDPLKVVKFTWIIFTSENIGNTLYIPYNCNFLIVQSGKDEYLVKEIFFVKFAGPFYVNFGVWSNATGLVPNVEYMNQRTHLRGIALIRTDADGAAGYCDMFDHEFKLREVWEGYAAILNFSIIAVNDSLENELIDGSSCADAHQALDYYPDTVNPTISVPAEMVIKFDNDLGKSWKSYLKPFDADLWHSILAFLIVTTISFAIIAHIKNISLFMNIFTPFYSFCYQGEDLDTRKIRNVSIWVAHLMPYIAAIVIVQAYSAGILSEIMAQVPKIPFSDFESFVKDGTYKIGAQNGSSLLFFFRDSDDPLINRIYRAMFLEESRWPNKYKEAGKLLCDDEKLTFVTHEYHKLDMETQCDLFKIPDKFMQTIGGFRMQLNSPFTQVFQQNLIRFRSTGIIHRENLTKPMKFKMNYDADYSSIEISQVLTLFTILSLGIFLSLIVLILEIFRKKTFVGAKHL